MHASNEPLISVQREWNGWRTAQIRVSALESVHWFRPSGAPRPLLHGYVSCEHIVAGDIDRENAGNPRHRVLVCVLKCHTADAVYSALALRADEQQRPAMAGAAPGN